MSGAWSAIGQAAGQQGMTSGFNSMEGVWGFMRNMRMQEQSQHFNADMFNFERMTRYPVAVASLKAADLNPMLALTQGVSGGSPSSGTNSAGAVGNADVDMVGVYNQTRIASAQVALLKAQEKKTLAEARSTGFDADTKEPKASLFQHIMDAVEGALGNSAVRSKKIKTESKSVMEKLKDIFKKAWDNTSPERRK